MKTKILTTLATMGFALGAFAQGSLILDNNQAAHGITTSGGFYTGSAGLQVWYLNGSSYSLASLNGLSADAAYAKLTTDGFTLATTFTGATIGTGGFALGNLQIPGITPAGSTATLAIAAWQGSGATFGSGNHGVLSFYQPLVDYTAQPPPVPGDLTAALSGPGTPGGFNTTDLALTAVPEPSSFALAGLGAAAMLIFRRRK